MLTNLTSFLVRHCYFYIWNLRKAARNWPQDEFEHTSTSEKVSNTAFHWRRIAQRAWKVIETLRSFKLCKAPLDGSADRIRTLRQLWPHDCRCTLNYSHVWNAIMALCLPFEGQFSAIPPHRTRIESPSATMSTSKPVVNDVRHKDWHSREIMHATFEAPVRGSKHEGADPILRPRCQWHNQLASEVQVYPDIVCSHQAFFKTLIRLSYTLAVVLVETSQGFNLVV